ncbi:hypothetical protein [Paraburkholderia sp. BCC1876]|uniref:hypothetical protein n=1 Tax=Paraburkholderia sp. BCC1876 TaxID=2676303 RepID=UPI001FC87622|nr:hypothetical protein [Paraburkholderia sp. BCC1876]
MKLSRTTLSFFARFGLASTGAAIFSTFGSTARLALAAFFVAAGLVSAGFSAVVTGEALAVAAARFALGAFFAEAGLADLVLAGFSAAATGAALAEARLVFAAFRAANGLVAAGFAATEASSGSALTASCVSGFFGK